jgi:hypothetical protein
MLAQEQLPLPPVKPEVVEPQHNLPHAPMGQAAVRTHERAIANGMYAEWNEQAAAFADSMGHNLIPDTEVPRTRIIARKILADGPDIVQRPHDTNEIPAVTATEPAAASHRTAARVQRKVQERMLEISDQRLDAARQQLINLAPEDRAKFNDYFDDHAPDGLYAIWQNWQKKTAIKDDAGKVIKKDEDKVNMLIHAPKETLLNFLQWHNDHVESVNNDPQLLARIAASREQFKESGRRLFGRQPFGRELLTKLDIVDQQPIAVGDVFDIQLRERFGHYIPSREMLVVGEDYDDETFDHELLHVLGWFDEQDMNEAMAEHLALVWQSGYLYTIDPDQRLDDGVYFGRRKLLAARQRSGIGPNLLPQAVDAFFEADPGGSKMRAYEAAETAAFGGIRVRDFVAYEKGVGMERITARNPKLPEKHKQEFALMHAAEGVEMLGAAARGVHDDEIIAEKMARFKWDYAQNPDTRLAARELRIEERRLREHLANIRRYAISAQK